MFCPPNSNAAFGSNEAALIQENGDTCSDLLYSNNFAFLGLQEVLYFSLLFMRNSIRFKAFLATGNLLYSNASQSLAEFFIRVQTSSPLNLTLDGTWYRGFDYSYWDYWGS